MEVKEALRALALKEPWKREEAKGQNHNNSHTTIEAGQSANQLASQRTVGKVEPEKPIQIQISINFCQVNGFAATKAIVWNRNTHACPSYVSGADSRVRRLSFI